MTPIELRSSCVCVLLAAMLTAAPSRADDASAKARPKERALEWVWVNGEGGVEVADLRTFNANVDNLTVGLTPTSGVGPMAGLGAGVRLLFLTLGVRGRVGAMQPDSGGGAWQLWTLDAEIGVRVPLKRFEPYLTLAGGYASLGNFGTAVSGLGSGFDVSGANLRLGVGLDVYVTHMFSVGGIASGEMLILARPGVPVSDLAVAKQIGTLDDAKARVLEANGTSVGGALSFGLVLGLHF